MAETYSMENLIVINGLRQKLADIQAEIRASNQRLRTLESDKAVVTRALRAFDGGTDSKSIAALGFQSGGFSRSILDTIREADAAVCAREIAERLAAKVARPLDKAEFEGLLARVREAVRRMADKLDGDLRGRVTYWCIKPE